MPTFIVSMQPNVNDGRRKTTKLTADEVVRRWDNDSKEHYLVFTNIVDEDNQGEIEEKVAEFRGFESWILEDVAVQGPRPAE